MYSLRTARRCRSPAISSWSRHSRRALPIQRSAIAFARGACTGVLMTRTPVAVNTASNGAVNLASPVTDQELEAGGLITEVHQQVAGLLGHPRAGGVGGDARQVDAPGGVFDEEHGMRAAQEHGIDVEEASRQDRMGRGGQKRTPCLATPVRRGAGA